MSKLTCFKAYDIRGRLGEELNEDIAYRIGRAFAVLLQPKTVAVGGDIRLSSESLKLSLARGLMDEGVNVLDIGLSGTEEIYFTTFFYKLDGGIQITASHNPIEYNGMKLVTKEARPISGESGLNEIQRLAELNQFSQIKLIEQGIYKRLDIVDDYISHLLTYIKLRNITPLKVVVNIGNGAAGHVIDALELAFRRQSVPITLIKIHNIPDGSFPNGIPNPLLPECRQDTSDAVKKYEADFGIAFDGDFDRCFFFDHKGDFIEGYYIVGLLADLFLQKESGAKIIHDPRLIWNTIDMVTEAGGVPVLSKTGHAFIKDRMRQENAIYGGEMSAHHYFRDFAYCDSGMIPWLLMAELICTKRKTLNQLVSERINAFPASGEINIKMNFTPDVVNKLHGHYEKSALVLDTTDGISFEFEDWRFNVRASNTEPLVRLNVESRYDRELMQNKLAEVLGILQQ